MTAPQHRIFMSHSHIDNDFGTRLAQDLRRRLNDESAVWYDILGLHGGDTWWEKIVEELTARDIFLVVLSPDAMNSYWVRQETTIAVTKRKFIVPVLYRDCAIRADLEIYQIISFLAPKPYETAFQEVLRALGLPTGVPLVPKEEVSQPGDMVSMLRQQIEVAFKEQDWPDVIRKADYLIKFMPTAATSPVHRWRGLALLEEGEVQQAQEALETALALVTNRELRLTLLSDYTALLARQDQWAKVLQRAREALRLVPNDPGWLATQQQAQSQLSKQAPLPSQTKEQGRPKEEQPAPPSQKSREQWLDEGKAFHNLKRSEEALSAYDQAIRLDPNYARAYAHKGWALNDLKRYEEALQACEQALRLDPNSAHAYVNKGWALNDLKRYEEALQACEQALRLDPNYADAYNNKGEALYGLKRYEEALRAYEQALRFDPNFSDACYNEGNALNELKRYEEALQAYNQALRLDPNYADAYYNKGIVLNNLKRYAEAVQTYDQALRLNPNAADAYYSKGLALERLGKRNEAQQARKKAQELGYK